jgi:hypothetical protein
MSETIKIHDIVTKLLESDPNLLHQKGHVADILEIPRAESQQIIKLHDVAFKSSYDLFSEFLVIWVGRQESDKATIGLLSTLLEENGFIAAGGESIIYLKYEIFS